ncbi:MAG TPA: cation:proton antiporter, partial [Rectinemataceae bacterium]
MNEPAGILAIVLAAAFLAPLLADVAGVPIYLTMTLAGFILGPSALGFIEANVLLQALANTGLVYAFFIAGGSLGFDTIRKKPKRAIASGILSAVIPGLVGFFFGHYALKLQYLASSLVGCLFAIHSGYTRSFLPAKERESDRPHAQDSSFNLANSLVVLVLIVSEHAIPGPGGEGGKAFRIADLVLPIIFLGTQAFILPSLVSLAASRTRVQGKTDALFSLLAVYASAATAPLVGLPTYVGGFLSGIFLSPQLRSSKSMSSRLEFIGDSFLMPFFLVCLGASIAIPEKNDIPPFLGIVLAASIAALVAKYLASLSVAWLLGWNEAERKAHFRRLGSFDAFSLGIAWLANASGLLDNTIASGAFLFFLISSLASSVLAKFSKTEVLQESIEARRARPRGGRILVALSKPATATKLVELGILLHGQDASAPLLPCAIVQDGEDDSESRTFAENMLAAAVIQGSSAQVPVLPVTKVALNAAEGIMESAAENKADAILIGWNKPPRLSNAFFGSVIEQIASCEGCMTLVARLV